MIKNYLLSICVTLAAQCSFAQGIADFQIPVNKGNKSLLLPWTGGLNAPQFSSADLNQDGLPDLFVFDRQGQVALGFVNTGKTGVEMYTYQEDLTKDFPFLKDWVLMRDYNGDDIPDIFTASSTTVHGIRVLKGKWVDGRLSFDSILWEDQKFKELLYGLNRLNLIKSEYQLFCLNYDIPGIHDVDGDGDLDLIVFNDEVGKVATYFKNISVEQGYGLDSILYTRENPCWGGFEESGNSNQINLSSSPDSCYSPLQENWEEIDEENSGGFRHVGSTLLIADFTGNGLPDAILGDVGSTNLTLLENNGTLEKAWMNKQDNSFPQNSVPAHIVSFPGAYYLDVDGDGLKDLIATSNTPVAGKDYTNVWLYKNTGTINQPVFTYQQEDFLVDEMIDFGTSSAPAFFDYNGDGLLDLVVANGEIYSSSQEYLSKLALFQNIGTATQPAFSLVDEDYLNFSAYGVSLDSTLGFAPHFADMDADGDMDLLVGDYEGKLYYAENQSLPGSEAVFNNIEYAYAGIDVGLFSVPFVYDVNQDGLPDLLMGEYSGNVNYFENKGTSASPSFVPSEFESPNLQLFGKIRTIMNHSYGLSAPCILYLDGTRYALSGTADGLILMYEWGNKSHLDSFPAIDHELSDLYFGKDSKCAFADLNGDGFLEMVCGNRRGGLVMKATRFRNDTLTVSTIEQPDIAGIDFVLAPNPVMDQLRISWENSEIQDVRVHVFHISGALVHARQNVGNGRTISTADLPSGSYIVRLSGASWNKSYPIVKF